MKVIEYNAIGNPADVLEIKDVPSVAPGEGQVRVKVLATPIHPSNLLQISGNYGTMPTFPAHPGAEGVGQVAEVGAGVRPTCKAGQHVLLLALVVRGVRRLPAWPKPLFRFLLVISSRCLWR